MKLVTGLGSLTLPERFYNAEKRIVMHAAIYGPFGQAEHYKNGLLNALGKVSFERLDVIALTATSPQPLKHQFLELLRPGCSENQQEKELSDSDAFLRMMKDSAPQKVQIHPLHMSSCQPILIIDNTLLFGQYAMSEKRAAEGFWGIVETDMEKLFMLAESNKSSDGLDEKETAAYRLVCECCGAMSESL